MALLATYVSATAALADSSDATYVESSYTHPGPLTLVDVPLEVSGAISGSGAGAISHVILKVRALETTAGGGSVGNSVIRWARDGFDADTFGITLTGSFAEYDTGSVTLSTDDEAWTWDKLDDTTAGVYTLALLPPGASATLRCAEVWVEVYGDVDSVGAALDLMAGDYAADLTAESAEADMLAGGHAADLTAEAGVNDLLAGDAAGDLEVVP